MGEVNFDRNIIVDNVDEMLSILQKECGFGNIDIIDIIEFVQGEKSTKFYFDNAMNGKDERSRDIRYLYAKPSYSTQTGSISWMIPLHINRELIEEPELVLVLRKAGEFYEIKTIIPYDDETKDKLTDLSLYSRLW